MYENWTEKDWKERLFFLDEQSTEWRLAWGRLAELSGDADREAMNPRSGEVWQYMGSVRSSVKSDAAWRHEFRHRDHPRTKQRLLLIVRATRGWSPPSPRAPRRVLH